VSYLKKFYNNRAKAFIIVILLAGSATFLPDVPISCSFFLETTIAIVYDMLHLRAAAMVLSSFRMNPKVFKELLSKVVQHT